MKTKEQPRKDEDGNPIVPFREVRLFAGALQATLQGYLIEPNLVELWFSVGNEVPHRRRGTISEMIDYGELWIANRKAEGFEEGITIEKHATIN